MCRMLKMKNILLSVVKDIGYHIHHLIVCGKGMVGLDFHRIVSNNWTEDIHVTRNEIISSCYNILNYLTNIFFNVTYIEYFNDKDNIFR